VNPYTIRVAEAVTEAAKLMNAPASVQETLDTIVRSTLETVPGFDHVGISITHRDGTIETMAGTDQLVWDLDTVQYELGEGPCYASIRGGGITIVEHARHEQRWPRYISHAVRRGLRAQLALGLYQDDDTIGGLNLYSTSSETVPDDAVLVAELFASHAAIALGRSRKESQLTEAIASRQVIGQAVGILMERYRIDEHRAFQFLIRASQTSNVKLRRVAEELVEASTDDYAQQPAADV
jgi:GAF domain-containing protein